MIQRALVLSLWIAAEGCGGRVDGIVADEGASVIPPSSSQTPERPSPPTPPNEPPSVAKLSIEGSFDVSFTNVVATTFGGGPLGGPVTPPSTNTTGRLDIRKSANASAYEAVFTSRWGTPAVLRVVRGPNEIILSGEARIESRGAPSGMSVSDVWTELRLPLQGEDSLTGSISAKGQELTFQGDEGGMANLTGTGKLVRDTLLPETRATLQSRIGPKQALLPWDPIVVETAEPLVAQDVERTTSVTANGALLPIAWMPHEALQTDWAGKSAVRFRAVDWTRAMQVDKWVITHDGGAKDRAGQPTPPHRQDLRFFRINGPVPAITFDGDTVGITSWGTGRALINESKPDARCEQGGCFLLGPARYQVCNAIETGVAAQLTRGPQGRVSVRYRVLVNEGLSSVPQNLVTRAISVQLANAAGQTTEARLSPSLVTLGTPIDGMPLGSAWATEEFAAPPGTGPIGFAMAFARGGCDGGLPTPSRDVELLIDSIQSN